MHADRAGLTMPITVSRTTATATNTAATESPNHQSSAAKASGSSRRVSNRVHRWWGAERGGGGISSQVDDVTDQREGVEPCPDGRDGETESTIKMEREWSRARTGGTAKRNRPSKERVEGVRR